MSSVKAIVAATIAMLTLLPIAGAQASNLPAPQPLKPMEVKWILGPGQSAADTPYMYGYETVDHDDFSYPPPRVP